MRASSDGEIGPNSPMAQSWAVGFIMASICAIRVATRAARFSRSTPRVFDTGRPHWLPRVDRNDGDDDGTSHTAPFRVVLFVIKIIKSMCYVIYCVLYEPLLRCRTFAEANSIWCLQSMATWGAGMRRKTQLSTAEVWWNSAWDSIPIQRLGKRNLMHEPGSSPQCSVQDGLGCRVSRIRMGDGHSRQRPAVLISTYNGQSQFRQGANLSQSA